jgi:hypothetical protein
VELVTFWSGTLERLGQAPGLSGYLGPSQLGPWIVTDDPVDDRRRDQRRAQAERYRARIKRELNPETLTPRAVRFQLGRGHSLQAIARRFGRTIWDVRRMQHQRG